MVPGPASGVPGPVQRLPRGVLLLPESRPRAEIAAALVGDLRRAGFAVAVPSGWEDHDAALVGSWLLVGELVTSSHPVGCVQLRVRPRLRRRRVGLVALTAAAAAAVTPWAAVALLAAALADLLHGAWRLHARVRLVVEEAAQ